MSAQTESADLDERDVRALTEYMTVLADVGQVAGAEDMYVVTTESGSEYTVDLRHGSCTCPDAEYRDVRCKHIRRAEFATGRRPIPEWVDADGVNDRLGEHVDGPVATDAAANDQEEGTEPLPDFEDYDPSAEVEHV